MASYKKELQVHTQGYEFKNITQFVVEKFTIQDISLDGTPVSSN